MEDQEFPSSSRAADFVKEVTIMVKFPDLKSAHVKLVFILEEKG
jgi:hypothetical protein